MRFYIPMTAEENKLTEAWKKSLEQQKEKETNE